MLLEAGKNQLRHHEVREQDVGRIVGNLLSVCSALLAGVTRHCEWRLAIWVAMQKLVELLKLRVGKYVHRINDDPPGALLRINRFGFDDAVDDGDEKRQRFAAARASDDDETLLVLCFGQRLRLVDVKVQVCRLSFGLSCLEDVRAIWMKHPVFCKLLNGATALVVGVDLDQWLWPVATTGIFLSIINSSRCTRNPVVNPNRIFNTTLTCSAPDATPL